MPAPPRWKVAIVVGASSGIGEAVARRLAASGTRVALVARRGDLLRALAASLPAGAATVREHDGRDGGAVPAVWESVEAELGRPDLLVYATGIMPAVGPREYSFAKDRDIVEVNLLGAMAWCDEAALRMESAGSGTIVGVSSVAGARGRVGFPAYCTSKAAMDTFLESLRNRLARKGVDVVTIRPGYVATPMTEGLGLPARATISADRCAELILRHAARGSVDVHVPRLWGLVALVLRMIPSFVFRRLTI
ncbi:MAG: putative oxidoreductase [Planctomycetes bacterium]|nr:putative oxidoreductase [Planctomycetota bacterium]